MIRYEQGQITTALVKVQGGSVDELDVCYGSSLNHSAPLHASKLKTGGEPIDPHGPRPASSRVAHCLSAYRLILREAQNRIAAFGYYTTFSGRIKGVIEGRVFRREGQYTKEDNERGGPETYRITLRQV